LQQKAVDQFGEESEMRKSQHLNMRFVRIALVSILWMRALGGRTVVRIPQHPNALETTQMARQLVLERIDAIAENRQCRNEFAREEIDLETLRSIVRQTRFYDAAGIEGDLRFSAVVGKPASPDQTLRTLALQVDADAFVLGYVEGGQYIRTRRVVLGLGYFEQREPQGALRRTTLEEKQALLLHEILHIALGKGDDYLDKRELCPLRLLSFCPRSPNTRSSAGDPSRLAE
jgi:hypothetical protein